MGVTKQELDSFSRFVEDQLANGGADLSLEELLWLWRDANSGDAIAAIRQGLADIEAGRYRPLDEFMEEFRQANNITPDE